MERKTDMLFEEIFEKLEPLKVNVINHRKEEIYQRNELTPSQEKVLESLNVENPPKILVTP
ncbi:hypothetical protein AKJ39_02400 [candidate division MSBL1 archaeon SCGC-AAA259J03]|uniref:Uncharacterized protein n=1 Tax=candidate division MSBL1 archaeon SCGC-AAA259J03 TaxID=1698269 RepID=A0A656YW70_9EURY|nr:hypothetical protein AKJ39_02400 [candidate division MSBL1 archaeon SCGC-AAA259J03]